MEYKIHKKTENPLIDVLEHGFATKGLENLYLNSVKRQNEKKNEDIKNGKIKFFKNIITDSLFNNSSEKLEREIQNLEILLERLTFNYRTCIRTDYFDKIYEEKCNELFYKKNELKIKQELK